MTTVSIEEVQAGLTELLDRLAPGEEVVVTRNHEPIAVLARTKRAGWPCKAGSAKDKILSIATDFDAPLEDFREYAP